MQKSFVACLKCSSVNRVPKNRMKDQPKCGNCHAYLPIHGAIIDQNSQALEALIKAADKPIVVDFWAPWCGPCLSFATTFEGAANLYGNDFIFVKLNTEEDPRATDIYQVRGIPTLIVFSLGKERQRVSGAMPMGQFTQWLMQARG